MKVRKLTKSVPLGLNLLEHAIECFDQTGEGIVIETDMLYTRRKPDKMVTQPWCEWLISERRELPRHKNRLNGQAYANTFLTALEWEGVDNALYRTNTMDMKRVLRMRKYKKVIHTPSLLCIKKSLGV